MTCTPAKPGYLSSLRQASKWIRAPAPLSELLIGSNETDWHFHHFFFPVFTSNYASILLEQRDFTFIHKAVKEKRICNLFSFFFFFFLWVWIILKSECLETKHQPSLWICMQLLDKTTRTEGAFTVSRWSVKLFGPILAFEQLNNIRRCQSSNMLRQGKDGD